MKRGKEGKRKKKGWQARGSRFTQNRFPLCLTAPSTAATTRNRLCASPLFLALLPPPLSHSLSLSPNFVANLRATKSAPFDFTLIRCRCRTVDEANLSLYAGQRPKGISFSAVHAIPSSAGLFQGNHFPSPSGSVLGTLYRCCVSLRPPLFPLIPFVHCSLSSTLLCSPLYYDLVSRNSALTSIRGRSRR